MTSGLAASWLTITDSDSAAIHPALARIVSAVRIDDVPYPVPAHATVTYLVLERELPAEVDRDTNDHEPDVVAEGPADPPIAAFLQVGEVDGVIDVAVVVHVAPPDPDLDLLHAGGAYGPDITKAPGFARGLRSERGAPPLLSVPRAGRFEAGCCGSVTETGGARAHPRPGPSHHVGSDQKSMSPPPGIPPAGAFSFSGFSATMASVVRNRAAIEAAFCSAERVTFAGSTTPNLIMSPYSPVAALSPWPSGSERTFSTTTPPSRPALWAICLSGSSSARRTIAAPVSSSPSEIHLVEPGLRVQQRHAAAGNDPLFDGRLRRLDRILDPVLLLLQLDLGGRADLDDGDAARELGQALLELLAVVVRVGLLDLGLDLVDPALDVLVLAATLDDRRVVLGDDDLPGRPEQIHRGVLQLEADLLGDDLSAREDRDVLQHGLAPVPEARGLDGGAT